MPGLKRRQEGEPRHSVAIGFGDVFRDASRGLVRIPSRLRRDRETCGEALQIYCEVDVRQGFVEIIYIEQRIALGREKCAEIHQMTVAAGLRLDAGRGLRRKIDRHEGGGAAQKGEWRLCHALMPNRQQRGQSPLVCFIENRVGIAIRRREVSETFARDASAQLFSDPVAFFERAVTRCLRILCLRLRNDRHEILLKLGDDAPRRNRDAVKRRRAFAHSARKPIPAARSAAHRPAASGISASRAAAPI